MGLLCPTEDYKVYGYITNTKNKFILVVDDYDVKEIEIKSVSFKNRFELFLNQTNFFSFLKYFMDFLQMLFVIHFIHQMKILQAKNSLIKYWI